MQQCNSILINYVSNMEKHQIDKLRDTPLDIVLEKFGAERDPSDPKHNWKSPVGRISVQESKFYNHTTGEGGIGAIDLVMHLENYDFNDAVAWLGGNIRRKSKLIRKKNSEINTETLQQKSKLPIPEADPSKLDHVKQYLIEKRAIPREIIEKAIGKGRIWADQYSNAVFSLQDMHGNQIGAELRGTFEKPFYGVRGEKGVFFTGTNQHKIAVFVESSIEALSYQAMYNDALVIGTVGSSKEIMSEVAVALEGKQYTIVDGFNKDAEGDKQGERLQASLTQKIEKKRPLNGKDWNLELQSYSAFNHSPKKAL